MEFQHRKNEPQSYAKFPAKLCKVSKYIFAELCGLLCETLRLKKIRIQLRNSYLFYIQKFMIKVKL
ncbi:MAG: hypothetical protein BWK80_20160 [Desulfobacteraceae bacterium IS3]|nr:MAG: hypothetical protein BWK80_20160 [Desulfobacteraceae bacterium IS3]